MSRRHCAGFWQDAGVSCDLIQFSRHSRPLFVHVWTQVGGALGQVKSLRPAVGISAPWCALSFLWLIFSPAGCGIFLSQKILKSLVELGKVSLTVTYFLNASRFEDGWDGVQAFNGVFGRLRL